MPAARLHIAVPQKSPGTAAIVHLSLGVQPEWSFFFEAFFFSFGWFKILIILYSESDK
jgi:hypothetical protein